MRGRLSFARVPLSPNEKTPAVEEGGGEPSSGNPPARPAFSRSPGGGARFRRAGIRGRDRATHAVPLTADATPAHACGAPNLPRILPRMAKKGTTAATRAAH